MSSAIAISLVFFSVMTTVLSAVSPLISSINISPSVGNYASDVGGITYTNSQLPTISANFDANGGNPIDINTAVLRINGVPNPSSTTRDAAHISYTPSSNLAPATYTVTVNVKNTAGISAIRAMKTFTIDISAPAAPIILSPVAGTYNNSAPTVAGTAEANSSVNIYDGVTLIATTLTDAGGNFSAVVSSLSGGSHTLTATSTDYAGNTGAASAGVGYTVDTTPPAVPALIDEPNSNSLRPTLEWGNVSGAAEYRVQIDDNSDFSSVIVSQITTAASFTPPLDLPLGVLYWHVSARDIYENESVYSVSDTFIIDTNNPNVTSVSFSDPTPVKAGMLTLTINFSENMNTSVNPNVSFGQSSPYNDATVVGDFNSPTQWQGSTNISSSTGDGNKVLKISSYQDAAGNIGLDDVSVTFTVDTIGPAINITAPTSGQVLTGGLANITWNATDATSGVAPSTIDLAYATDGLTYIDIASSQANSGTYTWVLPTVDTENVTLRVRATDNAGNTAASISSAFTIDKIAPAAPTGVITPSSPTQDNTPTITGATDGQTTNVLISVGSTTLTVVPVSGNYTASFSTIADGSYVVTAQAFDINGNSSSITTISPAYIIDTTAPIFSAASNLPADGAVTNNALTQISGTFDDTGSGLNTSSLRFAVNGIDITTNISWLGNTFTYTPGEASNDGSYTVDVDVADNAGNRSTLTSWTFVISSAPTISSIGATGGRVVDGFINGTNTGFGLSGNLPVDNAGIQTVRLYANDVQLTSTLILAGLTSYSINLSTTEFDQIKATSATKTFKVDRVGFSGNTSAMSNAISFVVDLVAPSAPGDNISLQQNAPGQNDTITGTAGAGSESSVGAYVYDMSDNLINNAIINFDGSFGPIIIGDNLYDQVKVAFRDAAGNESAKVGGFFNQIIAPTAPIISAPTGTVYSQNPIPVVTGSIVDTGTVVKIYKDGAEIGSGPVDENGDFSILTSSLESDGSYNLTAKVLDSAQNISLASATVTYVLDRIAPALSGITLTDISNNNSTSFLKNGDSIVLTATITDANQSAMNEYYVSANFGSVGGGVANPTTYDTTTGVATWAAVTVSGTTSGAVNIGISVGDRAANNNFGLGTIIADNAAPTSMVVADDGDYANSLTELHATWSAIDSESGIVSYSYAIGTTRGGSNIRTKTSIMGLATSSTFTGLSLAEGSTYYVTIYATNGAGIESNESSDGIIPDVSDPSAPGSVADDGDFTQNLAQLRASWLAGNDFGSGIDHYEVAIGTTAGGGEILPYTNVGDITSFTRTGLSLVSNTTYYISVKTVDRVGRSSAAAATDGIMADNIAPNGIAHTPGAITNIGASLVTVTWADAGSGFAADPNPTLSFEGGIDVGVSWNPLTSTVTYNPGIDFEDDDYSIIASITDRAGNVGQANFSFTIDTAKPIITLLGNSDITIEFGSTYIDAGATAADSHDGDLTNSIVATSNVNTLAIGDYTVSYDVSDAAGNAATTAVRNVHVRDTIAPNVNAGLDRISNGTITQTCNATDSGSGIASYLWTELSGLVTFSTATSATTDISATTDGSYTLRCTVTDNGSNSAYDEVVFIKDTVAPAAPSVNATDPIINSNKANISINGMGETGATIQYVVSDGLHDITGSSQVDLIGLYSVSGVDVSGLDDGPIAVSVIQTDTAGNPSAAGTLMVEKDTVAPTLTSVTIASDNLISNLAKVDNIITLNLTADEDVSSPTVTIAGHSASVTVIDDQHYSATYQMTAGDSEGIVGFAIDFSDEDGNVANQVTSITSGLYVIFDKTAPAVSVADSKTNDTTPVLSGAINDNSAAVSINVNGIDYPASVAAGNWNVADGTVSALLEGTYIVTATSTDSAGNSSSSFGTLVIDTTDPSTSSIVSPSSPNGTNDWYRLSAPTVALTPSDGLSGVGTTYYHFDASADVVYMTAVTMPEGAHTIYFHTIDQAGNAEAEQSITLKTDLHNPSSASGVIANSGNLMTSNKQVTVAWNPATDAASGIDHYLLRVRTGISGSDYVTGLVDINMGNTTSYTLTPSEADLLSEGTYSFGVRAVDVAGNTYNTSSYSNGVTIDISAPNTVSVLINNGAIYSNSASVSLDLTATDGFAPVLMTISNNADPLVADGINPDSGNWIPLAASKSWVLDAGDGAKTVYAKFKDGGGNVTGIIVDSIILDTAPPGAPLIDPISGYQGSSVNISGTAEANSVVSLTLTGGATIMSSESVNGSGNWSTTLNISSLNDGTVNLAVVATDPANNVSAATSTSFAKDTAAPSFSSITANPLNVGIGATVAITFTASENLQSNPTVTIAGNAATYVSNAGLNYVYSYATGSSETEGAKTILVSGIDLAGNSGSSTGSLVVDLTSPVINAGSPIGNTGNAVPTIQASINDIGGSGVNSGMVVMRINGIAVPAIFNALTGVVSYTPTRALSARAYTVTVDAKDNAGNTASRYSFTFTIVPQL